jgi:hypothetical protein
MTKTPVERRVSFELAPSFKGAGHLDFVLVLTEATVRGEPAPRASGAPARTTPS